MRNSAQYPIQRGSDCKTSPSMRIISSHPTADRIAGRCAVLHAEDELARVFLWFYPKTVLIGEERVVVEYGRGPAVPWIVVLGEGVDEPAGSDVGFAILACNVASGAKAHVLDASADAAAESLSGQLSGRFSVAKTTLSIDL